jgi:hypothetical protein
MLVLAAIVMAFIAGSSMLLSIAPPPFPELRIDVSPPGYPPSGESWKITVWEWNGSLGSTWLKASNASVTLFQETDETWTTLTGIDGEAVIQYRPEYGHVRFEASKSGFPSVDWSPAYRFISLEIVIASYTLFFALAGATVALLKSFFDHERSLQLFVRICGYGAGLTLVVLSFLEGTWFFRNLYTGATWGFNETVFGPIVFEHLFLVMGVLIILSVICGVHLWVLKGRKVKTTTHDNEMIV